MLRSRNLDDQTFEEIMEFAVGRLPWLCPDWTDYNAHDPGITILELIAWYKEMQQFHLNNVSEHMRKKLLKLLGVTPRPHQPSRCFVELPPGCSRPALSRLETEDIAFELPEGASGGASVRAVYVVEEGRALSVMDVMEQPKLSFMPFNYGGGRGELWIGLDDIPAGEFRLYFEIDGERAVARNPFDGPFMPREIEWALVGGGRLQVSDETRALSQSGYVSLTPPDDWPVYRGELDLEPLRYIRLRLLDPGCEERVRLNFISAGRYGVVQRETWSCLSPFVITGGRAEVTLSDEISLNGAVFAFVRESGGLRQVEYEESAGPNGRSVSVGMDGAAPDGEPNLFLVSVGALHERDLFFNSAGLPNMALELPLYGKKLLTESCVLICDTLCEDGNIRPAFWHYADDLGICAAGERAFTVDHERERLLFGDGEHGAVVPRGENAILLASAALSHCADGNVPSGRLRFASDGAEVENTAAEGGANAQSVEAAARAFLRKLEYSRKCASERDYERAALATPGLRVAAAKAIAGYDPDEPAGKSALPIVSVVAVPYSSGERPMPDARFLGAVQAHLSRLRPVCTKVKVVAPRYVPVGLYVQARAKNRAAAAEQIRQAARRYLELGPGRAIGDGVVRNDLAALFMKIDGIYMIEQLELSRLGPNCYTTAGGDILVPRNAVAYLTVADVDIR